MRGVKHPRSRGAILPGLFKSVGPLLNRGRRESRALAAPAAPCAMVAKERTRIRQVQPRHPGFPRAMALRLIRALPGEAAFLAPVVSAILRANVAPGSRRQDHTISPYAAAFSSAGKEP